MAYLKQWAPRAHRALELRRARRCSPGPGRAVRGDAMRWSPTLGPFDLAYLDPPYNQHRYETNYHVWETLVAWDAPEHYGVACKRVDAATATARASSTAGAPMPDALAGVHRGVDAPTSWSCRTTTSRGSASTSWSTCARGRGAVEVAALRLEALRRRADRHPQPAGRKRRAVSHLRNTEYLVVSGSPDAVERARVVARGARRAPPVRRRDRRGRRRRVGTTPAEDGGPGRARSARREDE